MRKLIALKQELGKEVPTIVRKMIEEKIEEMIRKNFDRWVEKERRKKKSLNQTIHSPAFERKLCINEGSFIE